MMKVVRKSYVGGYIDADLAQKLSEAAENETRGNKSAMLEIFLREGVGHPQSAGTGEKILLKGVGHPERNQ